MNTKFYSLLALVMGVFAFGQCPVPVNVTVGALTPSSIEVESGDDTVTYDLITTALPGTVDTSSDPVTFNDVMSPYTPPIRLAANYTYEFWVRTDCGQDDADVSDWVGPFYFTTQNLPSCPMPTGVMTTDITTSGATFAADDAGAVYDIKSKGVAAPGELTDDLNEITTPTLNDQMSGYTISGLPANTTFEYYVRQDCGMVDDNLNVSQWDGPHYFTTATPCTEPSGVTTMSVTDNSADFTADNTTSTYDIVSTATPGNIPVDGSGQPTMAPQFTGVTVPYTASNLAPDHTYEYYVRDACGSDFVGPYQFTTSGAAQTRIGVSPNPTTGLVNIEGAKSIKVYDLNGNTKISEQVTNGQADLSKLTNGQYVMQIVDANGNVTTEQIIKK